MKTIKLVFGILFVGLTLAYIIQFFGMAGKITTPVGAAEAAAPVCLTATVSFLLIYSALRNPIAKRAQ